jgi:threonine aldolase
VADAPRLVNRLAESVEMQAMDARRVRAVTHLDVTRQDVTRAVTAIAEMMSDGTGPE